MIQVVKTYSVPRKVAVDASMSLYQFLIAVRQVVSKEDFLYSRDYEIQCPQLCHMF